MATLKDVAKLACVDVSTVSRALNNTSYVHPDTKARILRLSKNLVISLTSWLKVFARENATQLVLWYPDYL